MLSVSAPDKSSQFINEIDGIAYRQFLHSVFSHARLQRHQRGLISSLPKSRLAQEFERSPHGLVKLHHRRDAPPLPTQFYYGFSHMELEINPGLNNEPTKKFKK